MKRIILIAVAMLAAVESTAVAATITFTAPAAVSGPFDVVVRAQNVFGGRDPVTDILISYGFDVSVSDPGVLGFLGATSGPLFEPATAAPGTDVFAAASGQNGFGIEPGAPDPLLLATLHFAVLGTGPASIVISSDLTNLFQGLQFLNRPFQESIGATLPLTVARVPEPATLVLSVLGLVAAGLRRGRSRPSRRTFRLLASAHAQRTEHQVP